MSKIKVEFNLCDFDELSLGIFLFNGCDGFGECNIISFGFILFTIDFIRYK
jgi:hypothetical protein